MAEEVVAPTEDTVAQKKPKTRNAQDQRIADRIARSRTLLNRINSNPALAAKCAERSFDHARIQEGIALTDALQNKFAERQSALGTQNTEVAAMKQGYQLAYNAFFELRESSRIAYPDDPGSRAALGATGTIPTDSERFQTMVRAALLVAAQSPHKADLATVGFTDSKRETLSQLIDLLEQRRQLVDSAKERARQATQDRDAADAELMAYLKPLERVLKLIERVG